MSDRQKTVWLFQIGEPLPLDPENREMRTALLAKRLAKEGYNVVWWASAFDHQKKKWIAHEYKIVSWQSNIDIVLLKGCGYLKNLSIKRFYDHRLIAKQFKSKCNEFLPPDLVVASMPTYDLALEAIRYAKKKDIPSVVDIRDMWPDVFLDYLPKIVRPFVKLVLRKDYAMLKECLNKASALSSMMDEVLQWGVKCANRPATGLDKVFYLGGEPLQDISMDEMGKIKKIIPKIKGKFVVCFIGTFGYYNNPSILVDVAKELQDQDVIFVLGGDGVFFQEVKNKSKGLTNVILPGWLNKNEIQGLLKFASVGVIPATKKIKAFPNKAFVYFSAGIPLVSACHGELKNVIKTYGVGSFYSPNNVSELKNAIMPLINQNDLYVEQCANSKKLFENQLDADKIYSNYVVYLNELMVKTKS